MGLVREGSWRFRFEFDAPIQPKNAAGRLRSMEELTQRYASALERLIQRHSGQWIRFSER
jgi:hypothetical protein